MSSNQAPDKERDKADDSRYARPTGSSSGRCGTSRRGDGWVPPATSSSQAADKEGGKTDGGPCARSSDSSWGRLRTSPHAAADLVRALPPMSSKRAADKADPYAHPSDFSSGRSRNITLDYGVNRRRFTGSLLQPTPLQRELDVAGACAWDDLLPGNVPNRPADARAGGHPHLVEGVLDAGSRPVVDTQPEDDDGCPDWDRVNLHPMEDDGVLDAGTSAGVVLHPPPHLVEDATVLNAGAIAGFNLHPVDDPGVLDAGTSSRVNSQVDGYGGVLARSHWTTGLLYRLDLKERIMLMVRKALAQEYMNADDRRKHINMLLQKLCDQGILRTTHTRGEIETMLYLCYTAGAVDQEPEEVHGRAAEACGEIYMEPGLDVEQSLEQFLLNDFLRNDARKINAQGMLQNDDGVKRRRFTGSLLQPTPLQRELDVAGACAGDDLLPGNVPNRLAVACAGGDPHLVEGVLDAVARAVVDTQPEDDDGCPDWDRVNQHPMEDDGVLDAGTSAGVVLHPTPHLVDDATVLNATVDDAQVMLQNDGVHQTSIRKFSHQMKEGKEELGLASTSAGVDLDPKEIQNCPTDTDPSKTEYACLNYTRGIRNNDLTHMILLVLISNALIPFLPLPDLCMDDHISVVWGMSLYMCTQLFLMILPMRTTTGVIDTFSCIFFCPLLGFAATKFVSPLIGVSIAYLSIARASGMFGHTLAQYRLHVGTANAAGTLNPSYLSKDERRQQRMYTKIHSVFYSSGMILCLSALMLLVMSMPTDVDIYYVVWGLSVLLWWIMCFALVMLAAFMSHGPLVTERMVAYHIASLPATFPCALISLHLWIWFSVLQMMLMAAYFGYMVAVYARYKKLVPEDEEDTVMRRELIKQVGPKAVVKSLPENAADAGDVAAARPVKTDAGIVGGD